MDSKPKQGCAAQTDCKDTDQLELALSLPLDWLFFTQNFAVFVAWPMLCLASVVCSIRLSYITAEKQQLIVKISYAMLVCIITSIMLVLAKEKWEFFFDYWQKNWDLDHFWMDKYNSKFHYDPRFPVWQHKAFFWISLIPYVTAAMILGPALKDTSAMSYGQAIFYFAMVYFYSVLLAIFMGGFQIGMMYSLRFASDESIEKLMTSDGADLNYEGLV